MFSIIATLLVCPVKQFDPPCMTKHGVTHCWEYISPSWDPREAPSEWTKTYYYRSDEPRDWPYYPLEKGSGISP